MAGAVLTQRAAHRLLPYQEEVQVAGGHPQHLRVEHGVDVVRPRFEGHRVQPPVYQGLEHGAGHRGFTAPAGGGGKEQTGRLHSAPPVPLMSHTGFWASIMW